ncbi:DNA polymerase I [Aquibacillus albus]|uniref:DNA polymerase I n=1 Tax=Aquibacillus albus TaxID=1168171 RepID=A0ABS2N1I3_9BACI|nr:DNA polymerase I [Aquibacillus albus]MBM7571951.1 DNA polymerase-1 [Aquibacillus albus]
MENKLVLIDGNSIAYRAFFALPLLSNDKGVYTNAIYGFTTMLLRILENEKPSHMLVAFDAGKTTFRHETYQEYKGGRQKTPPELSEQFPLLKSVLDAFNVKHYQLEQYEADDIIGTLSRDAEQKNWDVQVISGDKDLLQLVSDQVIVNLTRKGISEVDTYSPSFLQEKLEISPEQIIDMKALMGDNSDNIPGVPGVGQKTAIKLLKEFSTLENLYENLDKVSGKKLKEKLENHQKEAFMSKELVTIQCDSPIEVKLEDISYQGFDANKVSGIFKELGFKSLLDRVSGDESDQAEADKVDLPKLDIKVVTELKEDMFTGQEAFEVEMLEENYHTSKMEGFAVVNGQNHYFIPTEIALESEVFKEWAKNPAKKKWVFDAKKVMVALLRCGVPMEGIEFDLLLASYLIDPSENHHDIPAISHRMGQQAVLFDEEVYGKGAKMKIPEEEKFVDHLVRKTSMIFSLKEYMEKELKENSQDKLFQELELPLAIILGKMEATGVQVDKARLKEMGDELQERLQAIEAEIHELSGEEFNVNSPKQLGPILFEKLGLPVIKKTKTGYSTSADILEQLYDKHPIIPKLLMYRQLGKLQSTYIEGLLKVVHPETNKIHTRFNQALTQTGRLSSTEPNLQNIPIRLEEGRKIRQAFVPSEENWYIFAADYSQIELRVLAHIANDEKLIQAFVNGMDIHTTTAMEVFHVNKDEVTANMRRHAKAVNFGIVYGISDYGLSQSLGITRKEAKQFIDRYLDSYPGVRDYMEDIVQDAKQKGYVTTLMNRRRYLPDITNRNFNRRSFAERTAMNTPIQGSAADIIKLAMINLHHALKEEGLQSRMLMQVHDELILEAPSDEMNRLKELVPSVMENAMELTVPLKVDYSYGKTWYDAK